MCFIKFLFFLKIPSLLLSLHFVVLFLHILPVFQKSLK
ncbi:hypothetical protein CV83915_03035 [Escherichia coli]|uniref:Uncharacterized protein n=1 Tax=Escherichia coli TaxID=562 RepID=A0A2H4TUW3_ECOLX|nr:hypothetical protein CV83915_03035 [Escherichia coli]